MSSNDGKLRNQGSKFHTILAGAISGLTARFLTAPLDVVKIRLQVQPLATSSDILRNRGILQTFKSLYAQGGVTIFWRGNLSASWLYIVYNTTQFSAYRSTTSILNDSFLPNSLVLGLGGALAGVIATATAYPFDLVRTRFAAQGSVLVYRNFRSSIKSIYNQEGPAGFYRGLTVAICQGAPYMGLLFGVYESLRPVLSTFDMPVGSGDAFAGAMASGIAKTGTYPLDLIRKRLQMQGPSRLNFADGRIPEYQKGFWSAGKAILRQEGWRGMYRGLSIGLVKATPTSTISMWSYGLVMRALER